MALVQGIDFLCNVPLFLLRFSCETVTFIGPNLFQKLMHELYSRVSESIVEFSQLLLGE